MNSKSARLAVAAVVIVAALAIGVERLTRTKPDKPYAFLAQIHANTALDLDPVAAIPLRDPQPDDFDVTWDSEGGGALKIMAGSSVRIHAVPWIDAKLEDGIQWAYSHLSELQESKGTRVLATESKVAAVLTNEGNVAVVEIRSCDEKQAWLRWQVDKAVVPGYGPVQIVTLRHVDRQDATAQECVIDLDTGKVMDIPSEVLTMPAEGMQAWLERNGVDAVAYGSDEGYGLSGVGLVFWTWPPSTWAGTGAVNLRGDMVSSSYQPRRPLLFQEDQYQYVFPFKTREGGIGMLQLLAVDKSGQTVQFRYRMVQDDRDADTEADTDPESERLTESVKRLMRFGLMAWKYAEEHDWRYPATIDELEDYAERLDQDFQWILDNVAYVGAGRTADDPGSTLIAYDKTLLATGKGTFGVFRDSHAEFLQPAQLQEHGITPQR